MPTFSSNYKISKINCKILKKRGSIVQDSKETVSRCKERNKTVPVQFSVSVIHDYTDTLSALFRIKRTPYQRYSGLNGHFIDVVHDYIEAVSTLSMTIRVQGDRINLVQDNAGANFSRLSVHYILYCLFSEWLPSSRLSSPPSLWRISTPTTKIKR